MDYTFTYNGISSDHASFGISHVYTIERAIASGNRQSMYEIKGRDGLVDDGADKREAITKIGFVYRWDDYTEMQDRSDAIAAWLNTGILGPLTLSNYPGRFYMAKLSSEIKPANSDGFSICEVYFIAPEGCSFDNSLTTFLSASGALDITNAGTRKCPCIITAELLAGGADLTLTLTVTEYINLDHAFVGAEIVEIDTGLRTLEIDGADGRPVKSLASSYFWLPVGTSRITPVPDCDLEVVFRQRYS